LKFTCEVVKRSYDSQARESGLSNYSVSNDLADFAMTKRSLSVTSLFL
jgi:hypothetical protein